MQLQGLIQITEANGLPDQGELVSSPDRFKTKIYKNAEDTKGKNYTVDPNDEFQVVEITDQVILMNNQGVIYLEIPEFKKLGFEVV